MAEQSSGVFNQESMGPSGTQTISFEQWLLNPHWLMISLWVILPLTHWEFSLIIIEHELGVTS